MTPEEARLIEEGERLAAQLGLDPRRARLLTALGQAPRASLPQDPAWLPTAETARDVGRETALGLTGYTAASEAGGNLAEAEAAADPMRAAGAVGQGALAALPYSRLGRAMFATLGRGAATGGGMGATGAVAGGALSSEAEAAEQQRRTPSPTGAKPPAPAPTPPGPTTPPAPGPTAADTATGDPRQRALGDLRKTIAATQKKLEAMATTRYESTTARKAASQPLLDEIEAARARITKIEDEFANEAAATRKSQERWRERNPDLAANWPWMVPAAAAAAGAGVAGLQRIGGFLQNVPWHAAVRRAERALERGSPMAAPRLRGLGERVREFDRPNGRLASAMAGVSSKLPMLAGASIGAEGAMLPLQIDINNLGFGRALDSPWELGKAGLTGAMGALTGGTAGKAVGAALPRSLPPVEQSRALAAELTPTGQRETRRLLDAMTRAGVREPPSPTGATSRSAPATAEPTQAIPTAPATQTLAPPAQKPRSRRTSQATTSNPSPELQALEAELANVPADQRLAYIMTRLAGR